MFGNLGKMMKAASQMKAKLPQVQERIANSRHTADAGGGAVSATVNGKGELVDIRINPASLADAAEDATMLEDLIKASVSAAQQQAAAAAAEAMKELTGGMDLPGLTDMM